MAKIIVDNMIGTREERLQVLAKRRENPPEKINNASHAESSMYFYCENCGYGAAVLPERYIIPSLVLCLECQSLKNLGWLE